MTSGGEPQERRKVVSVLFCDLTGSTSLGEELDPEALRVLLARYFERMRAIVERDGGTVEKFIGDAVMAVFGEPLLHEDDALRACRAATEMQVAFTALGLEGRIGVTTGEVVTGTEERLVTGDPVNVAARLEQAAEPGEILIDEATVTLGTGAVEAEPVEPLTLKGKSDPVAAFRLLAVHEAQPRHEARFVGRTEELRLIRAAWERAHSEQRCELVTIVGEAGVGKSRLVAEALAGLEAHVVQGRCLPYGDGITYWPLVEVIKQLGTLPSAPAAAAPLRALLGETRASTTADEIAWAFRKLVEQEAPLVAVFDDLQWGEQTFLDLVESVAPLSSGAPLLVLCLARPELLTMRSEWPVALHLEPLPDEHVTELIGGRVSGAVRDRIARAAGGNPLFVTEMLAMASASGEVEVPPTLRALLAARLDQLDPPERRLLERAAIEGEIFHRGAVQALAPEEQQVTHRLATLVHQELIRPDKAQIAGEDGFCFRHLLIRDAAYDGITKGVRADLHERFADWLEEHGTRLVELDELLGYHLEQACRYRREIDLPVEPELAAHACERLTAAGRRAVLHADFAAAAGLLSRAAAFLGPEELDLALEFDREFSLFYSGDLQAALERNAAAMQRAAARSDDVAELKLSLWRGLLDSFFASEGAVDRLEMLVAAALPRLEAAGDHLGLAAANIAAWMVANGRGLFDDAVAAADRAVEHARLGGISHHEVYLVPSAGLARWYGSTPIPEFLRWLDQSGGKIMEGRLIRAEALAMLGRVDEARAILAAWRAEGGATGTFIRALAAATAAGVELLLDDPAAAADLLEQACALSARMGERANHAEYLVALAEAQCRLGRLADAERSLRRSVEIGATDRNILARAWRLTVDAAIHARRQDFVTAEALAREAVAVADATQLLNLQADAYAGLGEVLALAGKTDAAREALDQAVERYGRKGNLLGAERARAMLAGLEPAAARSGGVR